MPALSNMDAFVKPRRDLRSKSVVGGIITLIAATTAAVLFVSEVYLYIAGDTNHSLHLSESRSIPLLPSMDPFVARRMELHGKMPLDIYITFPYLDCASLDVKLDNAPITSKELYSGMKLDKRRPKPNEMAEAIGSRSAKDAKLGCTIKGILRIPIVAGHFSITMTRRAWTEATTFISLARKAEDSDGNLKLLPNDHNVTHYIHHIRFGTPYPAATSPLESRAHVIENRMGGIALENIQVKLVPTVYQRYFFGSQHTYQASVVDHTVQPETLVAQGVPLLPGLAVSYDFTPLAVHHVEGRDNFFVFMSSLLSIVGGVFVTVSMLTGCLVHSAKVVSKKLD